MLAAFPSAASAQGVDLVGKSDLGGGGLNGEVAVVGNTAIVGAGILAGGGVRSGLYNPVPCDPADVKVVDLTNPAAPSVASTIAVPQGVVAFDVAALRVNTPFFTGDLVGVALVACSGAGFAVDKGVAYYDVTDRANPDFLGRYDADADRELETDPPCGTPNVPRGNARCASSQDKLALVQRADGRVLSLSTEPFAFASSTTPSGDLRIVDVTNPAAPTQVGAFPNGTQRDLFAPPPGNSPGFSNNGCDAPFDGGYGPGALPGGNTGLLAFLDHGLATVDLSDPASPGLIGKSVFPPREGQREVEASFSYVDPASTGGRSLALVGESDYVGPSSRLRIDAPSPLAGSKFACEAMFTLFDKDNDAQVYRRPGSQIPGEIVYVGRGCPQDAYLNPDVAGKIVFRDRGTVASRQTIAGFGCSATAAVRKAQDAGALGVVVAQTSSNPQAFSFDGDPAGLSIPLYMIDRGDADPLRDSLCPDAPGDGCGPGGATINGAMVDSPGEWGALRAFDVTDPAAPVERGVYRTPTSQVFPPPDVGVYSVHHAVASGDTAYVAAHSDGLRVVDLRTPNPTETGSFVPPDTPDPSEGGILPTKAFVTGAAVGPAGTVVISDINSGLYVLRVRGAGAGPGPGPAAGPAPGPAREFEGCPPASAARNVLALTSGNDTRNGTPGDDLIFAGTGADVIDALAGDDCVDLGPGKDRGQGGPGDDLLVGGQGDDRVAGSSGNDRMRGNGGDDRLVGGRGNDRLFGQSGNDELLGGLGNDLMVGQAGSDRIVGSRGRDRINGGRGNDRLFGESSPDRINAGSGKDRVRGGSGNDVIRGDSGNDRLIGDTGRDRIFGGVGNDLILAVDGQRDRIRCGVGVDRVVADRIDRVDRASCERVRRVRKKRSRSAALGGVPALLRGVGF
jgi:hypothetical protein